MLIRSGQMNYPIWREFPMKLIKIVFLLFLLLFQVVNVGAYDSKKNVHTEQYTIILDRIPDDQQKVKRIFYWDNRIIMEAGNTFYRVDIKKLKALPVFCPGQRILQDLSNQKENKYYALCRDESEFSLFTNRDADRNLMKLPERLDVEKDKVFLLSDENHLILVTTRYIYRFINGYWKKVKYKQSPWMFGIDEDDHLIIFKDKIFIGHDFGEFGGGLVSLDINTGKWEKYFSDIPVTGLVINSKGELWASQGLAHGATIRGKLRVFNGEVWRVFSENEGSIFANEKGKYYLDVNKKNWPFDPMDFDSLTFDRNDNLFVLSGHYGILKYQNGDWVKWIKMTDDEYLYFSSFYVLNQKEILIGLPAGGLIVLNLTSKNFNRISFGEVFGFWDNPPIR